MTSQTSTRLRLARLRKDEPTEFHYVPTPETAQRLKDRLGLSGLRKMRLAGSIAPDGRNNWRLTARLGATVVQPCSVTLEPVTTRIEEPVERLYIRDLPAPNDAETEMPEDDTQEPLPETIDLAMLAEEALALAVPAFPRADKTDQAAPFEAQAIPPGATPIEDDATESPFAALEALKRELDD